MTLGSNTSGHLFDTTFTTNGVLHSAASGVITSTAAGTTGQVLTATTGSAPTWGTASSIGASWVLIQSQDTTGATQLLFTTGITATYSQYALVCSNYLTQNGGEHILMRVSIDGGATYISSGYLSGINTTPYNSTVVTNTNITTGIYLAANVSGSSTPRGTGVFFMTSVTNGGKFDITGQGGYLINGGTLNSSSVTACYNTDATINALIIYNSAGNNIAGRFSLYGIRMT